MKWFVITPAYECYPRNAYVDPEPPEYVADVVEVDAPTKRQALVQGVRELRRTRSRWLEDQVSNGSNPFTGLKAETFEQEEETQVGNDAEA